MNTVAILGLAGTIIGLIRALPQLLRLLHSKEAFGVSIDTALTSSIVGFGWAIYGFLTQQPYVSLATGSSAVVFLAITASAIKFGRKFSELRISPVWFCALLFAFLIKEEVGLGIVLPISILVSNIPQIYVALREEDLTDLSLGTWVLSMSDGFVWGIYSLIDHDYSIMVCGLLQLITSGTVTFLKLSNNKKLHARKSNRSVA